MPVSFQSEAESLWTDPPVFLDIAFFHVNPHFHTITKIMLHPWLNVYISSFCFKYYDRDNLIVYLNVFIFINWFCFRLRKILCFQEGKGFVHKCFPEHCNILKKYCFFFLFCLLALSTHTHTKHKHTHTHKLRQIYSFFYKINDIWKIRTPRYSKAVFVSSSHLKCNF